MASRLTFRSPDIRSGIAAFRVATVVVGAPVVVVLAIVVVVLVVAVVTVVVVLLVDVDVELEVETDFGVDDDTVGVDDDTVGVDDDTVGVDDDASTDVFDFSWLPAAARPTANRATIRATTVRTLALSGKDPNLPRAGSIGLACVATSRGKTVVDWRGKAGSTPAIRELATCSVQRPPSQ